MNSLLAGLGMLGAALAAGSHRRYTITLEHRSDGQWRASISGGGVEYLPLQYRYSVDSYGWRALQTLGDKLSMVGFAE